MLIALLFCVSLCSSARAAQPAANDRFLEAIRRYQSKSYPLALEEFRALADAKGADPIVRIAVCLTELHLGREVQAAKDFRAYAASARKTADVRPGNSMRELEIVSAPFLFLGDEPGRPALLTGLSDALAKSDSGDALAWELRGYGGLQLGDKGSLDVASERLRTIAPESALGPFFEAFSAALAGDRTGAEAALAEAVRRDPDFSAARAALKQMSFEGSADALAHARSQLLLLLGAAASIFVSFRLRASLRRDVDAPVVVH